MMPPWTKVMNAQLECQVHCLLIDNSGETRQLDIAKQEACKYIASLSEGDFLSIVTYSSAGRTIAEWLQCTVAGKHEMIMATKAISAKQGTTSLTAGTACVLTLDGMRYLNLPLAEDSENCLPVGETDC